jgi:hypothetical protein
MSLKDQLNAQRMKSEFSHDQAQIDIMKSATKQLVEEGIEKMLLGLVMIFLYLVCPTLMGRPLT